MVLSARYRSFLMFSACFCWTNPVIAAWASFPCVVWGSCARSRPIWNFMCTIVLLPCQHASSIIYNYIYIFKPICPPHNSYLRSLPNRDVFWAKIWTAERSGIDSNECRNKCLAKCRPSNCIASCQPWLHGFMMVNIQLYRNCLASKLSSSWIIMYVSHLLWSFSSRFSSWGH